MGRAVAMTRHPRAPISGLVLLLAGLAWAGPAPGAVCPPETGDYRVDVAIDTPPATLHHELSRAQLGVLAFHGPSNRVLGITAANLRAASSTHYRYRPMPNEGICIWVDHIDVTLRYEALDIYIASDYAPESCQYKAILNHENKHAAVARAHIDDYVQVIRSVLTSLAIPKSRDPRLVQSVTEAQAKIQMTVETLLDPVVARLRKTMVEAQQRIDSREEYRRVETQCPSW
jgi:hypothetical protein